MDDLGDLPENETNDLESSDEENDDNDELGEGNGETGDAQVLEVSRCLRKVKIKLKI